jgi:carboxyl-terminal processing protease
VRNNGGWYLDQVAEMLSYMVPENEPTAIIKYLNGDRVLKSQWYKIVDFNDYKIVVLQNSWTASASEILAGTIKDYYPDSVSIGEQSYWKGSVQQMKEYKDGSLLKYTVARWYTGGEERWIDGVGLTPDILIELDMDQYKIRYR